MSPAPASAHPASHQRAELRASGDESPRPVHGSSTQRSARRAGPARTPRPGCRTRGSAASTARIAASRIAVGDRHRDRSAFTSAATRRERTAGSRPRRRRPRRSPPPQVPSIRAQARRRVRRCPRLSTGVGMARRDRRPSSWSGANRRLLRHVPLRSAGCPGPASPDRTGRRCPRCLCAIARPGTAAIMAARNALRIPIPPNRRPFAPVRRTSGARAPHDQAPFRATDHCHEPHRRHPRPHGLHAPARQAAGRHRRASR